MAPIAERFVRIRPDMDRFGPDVKRGIDGNNWEGHGRNSGRRMGAGFASGAGAAIGTGFKAIAGGALVLGGAGVAIKRGLIDPASDLSETINKTNVVFGKSAPVIREWAQGAAISFGLSEQAALAAASQYGDMFQQLGFTGKAATKASQSLVKTAADLGSFHNVDPSDVLDRIGAALRGEYDSLQQLIPNINAARVEQEALGATGKKSAKDLTAAEKASAALAIVQRDGANAANDFAETSDGAANKQRIFAAQLQDVRAQLGEALVPAFAAALGGLSSFVGGLQGVSTTTSGLGSVFSTVGLGLRALVLAFKDGDVTSDGFVGVMERVGVTARAVFDYFRSDVLPRLQEFAGFVQSDVVPVLGDFAGFIRSDVVPALRDIGSFVGERVVPVLRDFAGFITGTVVPIVGGVLTQAIAGARSAFESIRGAIERNRPTIDSMLDTFRTVYKWIYENLVPLLGPILREAFAQLGRNIGLTIDVVAGLWKAFQKAASLIGDAIGVIRSTISGIRSVVDTVRGAFEDARAAVATKIGAVITLVKGLPGKAAAALGDLSGALREAGRNLIQGLINGINDKIGAVKSTLTGLTDKLPNWKGPPEKDRKLLRNAGRDIIAGLVTGLASGTRSVQDTLGKLTDFIRDKFSGGAESGLLAYLRKQGKSLRAAEKMYEDAAERVKSAKQLFDSALQERVQFGEGITSGLRGEAGILGGLDNRGENESASINGIRTFMQTQLGRLQQFAADLADLTARGLSGSLLGEIAGGGLGRGSQTARLLAGSDAATLANFNEMQAQIQSVTEGIGERAAAYVFGPQLEELSAGVTASELQLRRANNTLDDLADKFGDRMYAAIVKAQGGGRLAVGV